jgi:threonine aldolase
MIIDLRSDTVTKPSAEMLNAMMNAPVGDDVYAEDPTVAQLETKTAKLFSKESALFCPSGTMTNQVAIKCHTQAGDEVVCESNSHIYHYEGGGIAFNSSAQARLIEGERGRLQASQIEEHVNASYDWLAHTALVSLENTVNRAGGSYYSLESMKQIKAVCDQKKLPLHLDGARIFNAIVGAGYSAAEVGQQFDSISVCLSKGLGAPVGSLLLGSTDFIKKARRIRKVMGGGMRQAGFLAAAGIYALDHNITRLKEDHQRAEKLGDALKNVSCVKEVLPVDTNIVIFHLKDTMTAAAFDEKLKPYQIKTSAFGKHTVRLVTHLDFTDEMLDKTLDVLKYKV